MSIITEIVPPRRSIENIDANFAPRIFHPKTLDRLADDIATPKRGAARYLPADQCSHLQSERTAKIASYLIRRGNKARSLGLRSSFEAKYYTVCELARRKYSLPPTTFPAWTADEDRLATMAPIPNHRFTETRR